MTCGSCFPGTLPLHRRRAFGFIAWQMPEPTFREMLDNHRDWFRCTVCLDRMLVIGWGIGRNLAELFLGHYGILPPADRCIKVLV